MGWFLRAAPSDLAAPMLPWPLGPPTSKPYLSTQTLNPKAPYCCVELLGYPSPTCSFLRGSLWVVRCRERALQPTQEVEESPEPPLTSGYLLQLGVGLLVGVMVLWLSYNFPADMSGFGGISRREHVVP